MTLFSVNLETIPWLEIFWGLFISGILLTLLSLLSGLGEHDTDIDHDLDVDHDFDMGMDHDVDMGMDLDASFGIDHEGVIEAGAGAPFMLLFGGFLLIYGALGVILFSSPGLVAPKLFLMTIITLGALWLLNVSWRKVFKMVTYEIPTHQKLIGKTAMVVHTVDKDGGSIKVDIGGPKGFLKFPAIPRDKNKVFKPGTRVVIIDWEGSIAVVDEYRW